jgi:hypothetical protein
MNPYDNTEKLDKLFEKLNSIAHDRAGLFDTPIVNEVYEIIEKEKKDFWCDIALWIAHKRPEWYMEFTKYGAELLNLEVCEECERRLDEVKR